jgi:hypothetical protein
VTRPRRSAFINAAVTVEEKLAFDRLATTLGFASLSALVRYALHRVAHEGRVDSQYTD